MRLLPLALALSCTSAVAEDLPGTVPSAPERADSVAVPVRPEGFRLSGNLDLEVAATSRDGADAAAPSGAGVSSNGPANGPANASAGERSAWRLGEPIGYYPADRGVSKRF